MQTSAPLRGPHSSLCRQVHQSHLGTPLHGRWPRPAQARARARSSGSAVRCAAGSTKEAQDSAVAREPAVLRREADESVDFVAAVRRKTAPRTAAQQQKSSSSGLSGFFSKCAAAYRIFFPPRPKALTPKDLGRNRLRMILVADRCSMNPTSLSDMKSSIVEAVSNYVEVDGEEDVEVSITTDDDLGTIYSVAVPVRRVKPTARFGLEADVEGLAEVEWDESDPDADPSSRFPFGT